MKINNASLPYPLLGKEDDYRGTRPEAWIAIPPESNDKSHIVQYTIKFNPADAALISGLVREGKAALTIEIDSKATFLRDCIKIDSRLAADGLQKGKLILQIEIDKMRYSGVVSVQAFVTALEPLTLSNTDRFHPDYGKAEFEITPGDVLAAFPPADKVDLRLDWEHMYSNAGAPIRISKDSDKNAVLHTVLTDDYIEIKLPAPLHKVYADSYLNNPLLSDPMLMVLAPQALMTAIQAIADNPADNSNWANAIKMRIDTDETLREFRPTDGEWEGADLSSWKSDISKIAYSIIRGAEKKLINKFNQIAEQK